MITTNTGAKKLESSDNWREIFPDNQGAQGAHNASVGAHDAAICQTCQTITGTRNNSGHTINSGEFFIANGGKYKATASIPNGEPWASSAEPVTDNDLISALNSNLTKLSTLVNSKTYYYHIGAISNRTDMEKVATFVQKYNLMLQYHPDMKEMIFEGYITGIINFIGWIHYVSGYVYIGMFEMGADLFLFQTTGENASDVVALKKVDTTSLL